MDVSPNVLRKETVAVLKDVEEDLMRHVPGDRATLLLAKATCINTLVLLREERKK